MARVGFFRRFYLIHAGKRDAKGLYGSEISGCNLSNISYSSSQIMVRLVEGYSKKCQWKVANRKRLPKLYLRIVKEYEDIKKRVNYFEDETARMEAAKEDLENQLDAYDQALKKAVKDYAEANKTGIVTAEMGAKSLFGLNELVEKLRAEREKTVNKITELENKLALRGEQLKELKSQNSAKITNYINMFRQELDSLARQLKIISLEYEERFDIYWNAFLNKSKIKNAAKKTLEDLCVEQGDHIFTKDDLFIDERMMINDKIKEIAGFEVDV